MKVELVYQLPRLEKGILFSIFKQTKSLGRYLNNETRNGEFVAKNGWKVTMDRVPEVNVKRRKIYLRGSRSVGDTRLDTTTNLKGGNAQRDKVRREVDAALAEFVRTVAKAYGTSNTPKSRKRTRSNFETRLAALGMLPTTNFRPRSDSITLIAFTTD